VLSVVNADGSIASGSLIDEIVREGARRMLAAALEAEVNQYIAELAAETDERGRRLAVRNGHHRPRTVVTAAGPVEVTAPRVNDRRVDEATGERKRFSSKILAPWCRKSPKISEVLPLLYLHGLSSGDFVPVLEQFLGGTAGLSAATVTRLTSSGATTTPPSRTGACPTATSSTYGPTGFTRGCGSARRTRACWSSSASAWTAPRS
jgi:transposase-like protein